MPLISFSSRDSAEPHRTATPLELMFDLAAVIAIAAAAYDLHHGIAAGHTLEALPGFLLAFFMIWWSWMNYTWFASAYDDQSPGFQVLSMVAMFGALTIAAGIPAVYAHEPIYVCLLGFVIMRVAMAALWFGAAMGDPGHRLTALGYGFGIIVMQLYWVCVLLLVPPNQSAYYPLILAGILGELAVPVLSEYRHGETTWHRHHIIERYGLLNIIVLGECFLAIVAMLAARETGAPAGWHGLLAAVLCAVITFSLWGVYFTREEHLTNALLRRALQWGYGHFLVFASGAATGAGFAVYYEVFTGHTEAGHRAASFSIAVPVGIYLLTLWFIRDRHALNGWRSAILPVAAFSIGVTPVLQKDALISIAVLALVTVTIRRAFRTN